MNNNHHTIVSGSFTEQNRENICKGLYGLAPSISPYFNPDKNKMERSVVNPSPLSSGMDKYNMSISSR